VPENLLGQQVRCASCATVFEAQASEGPPPGPPSPSTQAPTDEPPGLPGQQDDCDHDRFESRQRRGGDDGEDYARDDPYDSRQRRTMRRDLELHRGGMVLAMGIISLVMSVCTIVCGLAPLVGIGLGITAVVMGHADLRKTRAGSMDPDGRSQTRAGMILGYIGIVLSALAVLACGAYVVFVLAVAGNNAGNDGM
jgi:hypothetical protein